MHAWWLLIVALCAEVMTCCLDFCIMPRIHPLLSAEVMVATEATAELVAMATEAKPEEDVDMYDAPQLQHDIYWGLVLS